MFSTRAESRQPRDGAEGRERKLRREGEEEQFLRMGMQRSARVP